MSQRQKENDYEECGGGFCDYSPQYVRKTEVVLVKALYAMYVSIIYKGGHVFFFFSSRRRHTRCGRDWSSDVCSSDLRLTALATTRKRIWLGPGSGRSTSSQRKERRSSSAVTTACMVLILVLRKQRGKWKPRRRSSIGDAGRGAAARQGGCRVSNTVASRRWISCRRGRSWKALWRRYLSE